MDDGDGIAVEFCGCEDVECDIGELHGECGEDWGALLDSSRVIRSFLFALKMSHSKPESDIEKCWNA